MSWDLFAGAANAMGSFFGNIAAPFIQSKQNKENRKWQEDMYARQRADSLSDWQMQADYNSPRAQMQRLKEANLNPNLIYGNGADATMGSPVRASSTGSYSGEAPKIDFSSTTQGLNAIYDMRLKDAQIDNLAVAKSVQEQDVLLKAAQIQNTLQDVHTKDFDLKMKNDLKDINVDMAEQALLKATADQNIAWNQSEIISKTSEDKIQQAKQEARKALNEANASEHLEKRVLQEIDNLKSTGDLMQFEKNLNRLGVTKGDNVFLRIMTTLFGKKVPLP